MAAAEQVLARDGADGFTVAAVAALSRVSIGGIYRRFDGRDTLLLAVKHRVLSELGDKVSVAADGAASLDEAVERFTRGLALGLKEQARVIEGVITSLAGDERQAESSREFIAELRGAFLRQCLPHVPPEMADPERVLGVAGEVIRRSLMYHALAYRRGTSEPSFEHLAEDLIVVAMSYLKAAIPLSLFAVRRCNRGDG